MIFVHATKGTEKVTQASPHALSAVDVNFPNPVPIVIARPFVNAMIDGDMRTLNVIVSLPFIGIRHGGGLRELCHMALQCFAIGVFDHAEPYVSTLAPDRADNRQTIIGIGTMPFLFVRTPPRWIARITMFFAFFPPHSETFRLFR